MIETPRQRYEQLRVEVDALKAKGRSLTKIEEQRLNQIVAELEDFAEPAVKKAKLTAKDAEKRADAMTGKAVEIEKRTINDVLDRLWPTQR